MFLLLQTLLALFEFLIRDSRPALQDSKTKLWSRSVEDEVILVFIETAALSVTIDGGCVR